MIKSKLREARIKGDAMAIYKATNLMASELRAQRDELLEALHLMLEVCEIMDRADGVAGPRSARWHAEKAARAAIAKVKGE